MRTRAPILVTALALLVALPAAASEVTAVRIGEHPDFTRIVFELDGRAGYKVERNTTAHGTELTVTIDASSAARKLSRRSSDVRTVEVAPGEHAVARIALRKGDLALKEMILSNPYRVVLDVMRETPVVAAKPAPKPAPKPVAQAETKPAPKPEAKPEPAPAPKAEAKLEPPKPAAKVEPPKAEPAKPPAPTPTPIPVATAEPKPAPKAEAKPAPAPAPAPEPKPVAKAEPKPAPAPEAKPEPPKPVTEAKAEPVKPGLQIEGKVEPPKPVTEAKAEPPKPAPAPTPAPVTTPDAKPAPKTDAKAAPAPAPAPAPEIPAPKAEAKAEPPKIAPSPAATPAPATPAPTPAPVTPAPPAPAPTAMPTLPAEPKAAQPAPPTPPPAPNSTARAEPTPPKRDGKPVVAPAPAAKTGPSVASRLTSPISLAVAGVVLVAVVAFVLMRRRRALPNDLDVTAIAEERELAPDSDEGTSSAAASEHDESSFAGLFDDETSAPAREPAPRVRMTSPASEPAPTGTPLDSLFDEDDAQAEPARQGAATMSTPTDLPMDRTSTGVTRGAAPARPAAAAAPAAGGDVMRLVQELERRIGALESKLDQANEAREKLERQVAAQSEELRVQRAAIARTQRALRTMSRGDEEKATEPALREETQTKIRPGSV